MTITQKLLPRKHQKRARKSKQKVLEKLGNILEYYLERPRKVPEFYLRVLETYQEAVSKYWESTKKVPGKYTGKLLGKH